MTKKPFVVLVGVDFSELADRAVQEGFTLAAARPDAEVHVVSIILPPSLDSRFAVSAYGALDASGSLEATAARLQTYVQAEAERFGAAHQLSQLPFRLASHVTMDTPAHGIAQLASDIGATLIVVGTHNRKGLERFLLGSVAEATVRYAHCPVLVIPAPQEGNDDVEIEPPCAACVQARTASDGRDLWCVRHSERHGRRHTYHQSDRSGSDRNFPLTFK
jgi:nucleotide-binding universal stress UspA family protein